MWLKEGERERERRGSQMKEEEAAYITSLTHSQKHSTKQKRSSSKRMKEQSFFSPPFNCGMNSHRKLMGIRIHFEIVYLLKDLSLTLKLPCWMNMMVTNVPLYPHNLSNYLSIYLSTCKPTNLQIYKPTNLQTPKIHLPSVNIFGEDAPGNVPGNEILEIMVAKRRHLFECHLLQGYNRGWLLLFPIACVNRPVLVVVNWLFKG